MKNKLIVALALVTALNPTMAFADPCGMVPPIWIGSGTGIERIGLQKTYVFYKDGIESFVIRPGFQGEVDEFGMLIPFPSPPAIRKVADDVFPHVAAAVDPPEVVVDLRNQWRKLGRFAGAAPAEDAMVLNEAKEERDRVTVISREAVGMYDVAVLDAGSAAALKGWMDEHGFRYPVGMDATCDEYVDDGWCFVAVKARVGDKAASLPRPGMRDVDASKPAGAGFDGHVQAMGFRFRTDELVVPMRLSVFNEGDLHNVVYVLTDEPVRIEDIPEEFVVRQIPGSVLHANVTQMLPLRVLGGGVEDIPEWRLQSLPGERDPVPHNGIARDVFASDLLAARLQRLAHPHEEQEKELLEISEAFGLRGPELDALHHDALADARQAVLDGALADLEGMTLTVVDGQFPREVLANDNLAFARYEMGADGNRPAVYDAKVFGPGPVFGGSTGFPFGFGPDLAFRAALAALLGGVLLLAAAALRGRPKLRRVTVGAAVLAGIGTLTAGTARAEEVFIRCGIEPWDEIGSYVDGLATPDARDGALASLAAIGDRAVPRLLSEILENDSLIVRGWCSIALVRIDTQQSRLGLAVIEASSAPDLVRTWATAGRIALAEPGGELVSLSEKALTNPALQRPLAARWLTVLAEDGADTVEDVLRAASTSWPLQQTVLPLVLQRGAEPLLEAMVTSEDQEVRRLAAGSLAALAQQGDPEVAHLVLDAYAFQPRAEDVPWSGGPLFVPGLAWGGPEAKELVRELLAWLIWCDRRGRDGDARAIHNNLYGIGLANAAGYALPSGGGVDLDAWILSIGRALGREEIRRLLEEQRLLGFDRYQGLLAQL